MPKKTNFIAVANHTSYLDPFIVGAAIPKKIYWIAFKNFYKSFWTRWFLYRIETLPSGNASEKLIYLLMTHRNVGIFPEGARTDGELKEFRRGAALLAIRTGRPIVPCAITGAHEALPRTARFPRFLPITIEIGKPQYLLKEPDDLIDDIYLQEGTFRIRNSVKELLHA